MAFGFETQGDDLVKHFADQVRGKTFLLTGPSPGGIGAETVLSLARGAPARLILLGRSATKCVPVVEAIRDIDPKVTVKFIETDLSDMSSVRAAAKTLLDDKETPRIDAVINNAAVMFCPYQKTADGFEMHLASGHLGHFVLTNLLMPKIRAAGLHARIVNVSSNGNKLGPIRFSDPNFADPTTYDPVAAYGQVKRANILYTVALNKRLSATPSSPHAFTLDPGNISTTNLGVYVTQEIFETAAPLMFGDKGLAGVPKAKTLQQGCATTLRAALDPALLEEAKVDVGRWRERVFLSDCALVTPDTYDSLAEAAVDEADAERLWRLSEELLGEKFDI